MVRTLCWVMAIGWLAAAQVGCTDRGSTGPAEVAQAPERSDPVSTEPVPLGSMEDVLKYPVWPDGTSGADAIDPEPDHVLTESLYVTERNQHLLYLSAGNTGTTVDGKPWPGEISLPEMGYFALSGDGEHIAYAAEKGAIVDGKPIGEVGDYTSRMILSHDGQHFAYFAHVYDSGDEALGEQLLVLDGKPGQRFTNIDSPEFSARFSPDGTRFVFVGQRGDYRDDSETYVVVEDDKASDEYDRVLFAGPIFSPDSKHLAWQGVRDGEAQVVLDGKVIYTYGGDGVEDLYLSCMTSPMAMMSQPMAFSADSRHFTFFDMSPSRQTAVLDGRRGKDWDAAYCCKHTSILMMMLPMDPPALHPKGHSVAFIGVKDDTTYLVSQGRVKREYRMFAEDDEQFVTGGPWWTSDGEHLVAVVASFGEYSPPEQGEQFVPPPIHERLVIDGEFQGETDGILAGPYFGDGGTIVYSARMGEARVVFGDGQQSADYDLIGAESETGARWAGPVLSPDGQHVAFAARLGEDWRMVVDGVEGPQFSNIAGPVQRWAPYRTQLSSYAWLEQSGEWVELQGMVEECVPIEGGEPVWSPDSSAVAYAACDDEGWHLVADGNVGEACDFIFPESIGWPMPGVVRYIAVRGGAFWRLTEDIR